MKYFLGYETTDKKIVKIDSKEAVNASTDLFDIVNFTMKFDSLRALKKHLYAKGLLPREYFSIYYCSQRKMSDPTTIKKLSNPEIKLSLDKEYYEPQTLRLFMAEHTDSIDFFEKMTVHYLRVLGVDNKVQDYLEDLFFGLNNPFKVREELKFILENVTTRGSIQEIINEIISSIEKNNTFYVSDFIDSIDIIIESICTNPSELLTYYSHIRKSIYNKNMKKENPILVELFKLMSAYYYNLSVKDYYSKLSLSENIDNLFKIIVCKYGYMKDSYGRYIIQNGSKKKGFIMVDDKYVLKSRALYDLGTFVRDYNLKLKEKCKKDSTEEEDLIEEHREEKEEFLTDEDYLKYGGV